MQWRRSWGRGEEGGPPRVTPYFDVKSYLHWFVVETLFFHFVWSPTPSEPKKAKTRQAYEENLFLGLYQARRHGRGALRGRASPNDCLYPQTKFVPPQWGLCPEEINKLGATEMQIEAWDWQNTAYRFRIRGKSDNFWDKNQNLWKFLNWRPFSSFFGLHHFRLTQTFQFT